MREELFLEILKIKAGIMSYEDLITDQPADQISWINAQPFNYFAIDETVDGDLSYALGIEGSKRVLRVLIDHFYFILDSLTQPIQEMFLALSI